MVSGRMFLAALGVVFGIAAIENVAICAHFLSHRTARARSAGKNNLEVDDR